MILAHSAKNQQIATLLGAVADLMAEPPPPRSGQAIQLVGADGLPMLAAAAFAIDIGMITVGWRYR